MTSEDNKAILAKIRKLLALATGNTNPNEATAAMKMAQKLLEQHRLTMADVTQTVIETTTVYSARTRITWKHLLLGYLAEANGCCVLVAEWPDRVEVNIAGSPFDLESVSTLFAWLVTEFERLASEGSFVGSTRGQYLQGTALGIGVQLTDAKKIVQEEEVTSGGIVLVDERTEKLRAELTKSLGVKNKTVRQNIHNEEAASRGFEDGKSMHLGKKLPTQGVDGEEPSRK